MSCRCSIHERLRAGEDPWDFMEDLPTVDELVVFTLRAENIADERRLAAQRRAPLPRAAPDRPGVSAAHPRGLAPARRREHAPPLGCDGACRGLSSRVGGAPLLLLGEPLVVGRQIRCRRSR